MRDACIEAVQRKLGALISRKPAQLPKIEFSNEIFARMSPNKMKMKPSIAVSSVILLSRLCFVLGDFYFADFNHTRGLNFNGAAGTTDCDEASDFVEIDGNDGDGTTQVTVEQRGHTATTEVFSTVETARHNSTDDGIAIHEAVIGHRDEYRRELDVGVGGCSTRLRLNPSHPSKAVSVCYELRVCPCFSDSRRRSRGRAMENKHFHWSNGRRRSQLAGNDGEHFGQ